jgi:hypothetical protein
MLGNLIVLSPGSPKMLKFRFTSKALWLLAVSCLISFLTVLIIQYTLPRFVSKLDPARLENENRELRVENRNTSIKAEQMTDRLAQLEEQSKRITVLMEAE